jgi:2-phosphosulfolactate phosphatase
MRIHLADFVEGARQAQGVVIVIDVFRACSLIAHALGCGARQIIPVADIDTARELKALWPEALLVGERHARPLPGFDCGNSPSLVLQQALTDRTLIHTTHAGTQGLTAAAKVADHVFTGALVNLSATVAAVRALAPQDVTIVAMGHEARERCAEDDLCREELLRALQSPASEPPSAESRESHRHRVREQLRRSPAAQKFFDPLADWAPDADFDLCTDVDAIPFAVRLQPLARSKFWSALPARLQAEVGWGLRRFTGVVDHA